MEKTKRADLIAGLPESFHSYLETVSEEDFISDLNQTLELIHGSPASPNKLSLALADYIMSEVASLLDRIPLIFFAQRIEKKREYLLAKTKLPDVFVEALSTMTYQTIFEALFTYLQRAVRDIPYVVVQFARDPEASVKKEMREHFKKEYTEVFPMFQVNKTLYGGMRVFINGKVTDQTWRGKIEQFTSKLTPHN